jgi:AraC-like DNA-binding protein
VDALLAAAVAFGLSQLLLSLLLLYRVGNWGQGEQLYCLLLLAIGGYLLTPLALPGLMGFIMLTLQTAAPGMFWLFSASVFDDHFKLRRWQVSLVAITVFLPLLGRILINFDIRLHWLFFSLPQALEFVLLALTLWVVSQHWRTDLVKDRRRLRVWFFGLNGSYVFALVFSREILFAGQAWLATWEYVPMALLLLAINATLLGYRRGVLFSPAPVSPLRASAPTIDEELVARLRLHMEEHACWREMGLTIGQLAAQLDVPQYRLREVINGGLGYRNFSDFLNSYRIAEASARLQNPQQETLPVLTIAMDAGFRSLSSFNKVFKEAHGKTPTQYRKTG